MNKPVLQILGAMLLHEGFCVEMKDNPTLAAQTYGYDLTPAEWAVLLRIVKSFKDDEMEDATENVRSECPNWPCNDGSLAA